ncbi:nucleotide-diphospho-sugar transferase [Rhizobium sp. PP-F2F-G48]|uniref:putative nucleotide-diphospho-sugar transferase n=1 Tax=Rhizobium sp. PP-F2F-G48 TaxID=2135651 RepID=UPI0010EDBF71|nr:putative nucleotide-diphospho-sugar transferase [Rhizobium sp. PP-F2F-G48]TCM58509.1 nucleotide-diphospho-sugar transferase [Rhizobium sp. PP-F2F-G48]
MLILSRLLKRLFPSNPPEDMVFPDDGEAKAKSAKSIDPLKTVIGFYTTNSLYENEAARMSASARRLGLSVETTPVKSAGSWVRNASLKAGFLHEQRLSRRGALLYVDVDAVFHNNPWPSLAAHTGDISVFYSPLTGNLLAGTILINDTKNASDLLAAWKDRCDANPEIWDQIVLEEIVAEDKAAVSPRFDIRELPASYCWIFDSPFQIDGEGVFIEHLQASREAKNSRLLFPKKRLRRRRRRIRYIESRLAGVPNVRDRL